MIAPRDIPVLDSQGFMRGSDLMVSHVLWCPVWDYTALPVSVWKPRVSFGDNPSFSSCNVIIRPAVMRSIPVDLSRSQVVRDLLQYLGFPPLD